jgi:hypothetical protein
MHTHMLACMCRCRLPRRRACPPAVGGRAYPLPNPFRCGDERPSVPHMAAAGRPEMEVIPLRWPAGRRLFFVFFPFF